MPTPTFVAIDIGSNAVRVKRWRLAPDADPEPIDFQRHPIRLGGGAFDADRTIPPETIDRLADLLRNTREAAGPDAVIRAVGTSALREAANRQTVLDHFKKISGIDVRVLTGDQEARLMALGILAGAVPSDQPCLLLDIGGGSTEIVRTRGLLILETQSLPLGTVRLRRRFLADSDPPSPEQRRLAERAIEATLDNADISNPLPTGIQAIGLAGTLTTLQKMLLHVGTATDPAQPIPRAAFNNLTETLATLPSSTIVSTYGIEPDRADVIFAGALILDALVHRLNLDRIRVVVAGLPDGLLYEYLNRDR
jgi:exopolyphosphatase/guanosine-5'-triphosphate,3'-diphosphate pyrophosphatase